jgi:apolipoprotein N-acyltransferase
MNIQQRCNSLLRNTVTIANKSCKYKAQDFRYLFACVEAGGSIVGMRKIPWQLWIWSAISALLQLLPFPLAGPVPLWRRLFCWVCLVPLLYALSASDRAGKPLTLKQSTLLSYFCGVLWYMGNCYWVYPTMHLYGGLPETVALGILLLFSLYVGLYHALFGWLFGWVRLRFSLKTALLLSSVLWVSVELARARITGFPWDLLGYTQVDNSGLAHLSTVTGVMGLSLLVAAVNCLWLMDWKRWAGPVSALVLVFVFSFAVPGAKEVVLASDAPTVVLLQDNLSVGAEVVGPREPRAVLLERFAQLTEQASQHPQLVLWPEAPADFIDGDPLFRQAVGALAAKEQAPVIADSVAVEPAETAGTPDQLYNSASFFAADGSYVGRYNKMHLVPFGEYTPYKQILFFAGHLLDNVGGFTPGTQRTPLATGGHRYGVFICYESIFGDEVREFAKSGADVLVNLSDDGWYGDSSAPWEHLDMVKMRAIENDRWVLRSTNTGVTTVIDPTGHMRGALPRHERAAMLASFGYVTETTFYTRHGDWVAWLCALLTAIFVLLGRGRRVAS